VKRPVQAVVLLLVGGAVLRISLTDMYLRFVKPGMRPLLIIAALMLLATAVMTLVHEWRGAAASDEHAGPDRHGRIAWLLIIPVFGMLLIAPPALGSYAASRSGTTLSSASNFPPLPAGDPIALTVYDYARRAAFDHGRSLGGRQVRLTGFVLNGAGGRRYLARMIVTCCAADASPVKVGLAGQVPAGLTPDTWLEVTGRYTPRSGKDEINGGIIPYLEVTQARPVPAPAAQYES